MTPPTLINGAFYRILTRNGRVWEKVKFDAPRLAFHTQGLRNGEPRCISLDAVERIAPVGRYHETSGGAPYVDVGEWVVQECAA